ncbi:sugar phosphate isomerase/epimerase [Paenibacillus validus]|uniref:sugar phosphate isomerase/epimerase family protein n=1 Tax=Paenibacillus TaxID=44249 RepID=UPI000FDA12B7|nr:MULTISPECIES: sugar phosphate isomerase/epimerase [Paenibacillus]MED4600531.1 sugar phosphate isomerase/epimerase [Paenibacillus validus]MED4604790.1 sugar phosphate isomerase/epimerase [Paenibacillus validus]
MKLGYQTNTWGGVVGHPAGVTSVKDLYYLANGSTEQAIQDIAAAGYKGIELFDGNLMQYADRPEAFTDLLKRYDLTLIGVYTGANFIYKDIQDDEFHKIEKVAEFASQCGAQHLVIGGGAIRAAGILDSDYTELAQSLDRAAAIAVKYNLIPSYHPHLGTIVQGPDQLDRIMELTSINLCPDTAHIEAGGGDPVATVKKYMDRILYIHFKDYANGAFLPLGEGHQNFAEMVTALRKNNYNGWITVELDSYEDPLKGAQISKKFIQDQLNIN